MDQNVYTVENNPAPMNNRSLEIVILVLGIASLASSSLGVGLVCGIVGLVLSSNYRKEYNTVNKMVNIGRGLSIAGIIVGAVAVVLWICYFCCLCTAVAGIGMAAVGSGYYN